MDKQQMTQSVEFSVPFDVIELPSKGLLYPTKQGTVKVEYMTAMDENILTSPNLLKSGKTLDVLLQRKVKESTIDPKDMLVGDRNAIIMFLRATAYGEMYPVKFTDPQTGEEFEHEVDLTSLKQKSLGAEPDENGEFSFLLPKSKKNIKFRFLTGRDEDEIMAIQEKKQKVSGNNQISNILTMRLERMITEIDGNRDKMMISRFLNMMPAYDSLHLRQYYEQIEPGIDLTTEVEAPSGETFRSIIPINVNFFWPNVRV
jgi:hypothetical protein